MAKYADLIKEALQSSLAYRTASRQAMVPLVVRIPPYWKPILDVVAKENDATVSDIVRGLLFQIMAEHTIEASEKLGMKDGHTMTLTPEGWRLLPSDDGKPGQPVDAPAGEGEAHGD